MHKVKVSLHSINLKGLKQIKFFNSKLSILYDLYKHGSEVFLGKKIVNLISNGIRKISLNRYYSGCPVQGSKVKRSPKKR